MSLSVKAKDVGKMFRIVPQMTPRTLNGWFARGFKRAEKPVPFWALRNISFEVRKGEALGIVGANGSGKSTLLRILSGILTPEEGNIQVSGRMGALLELGAGFHPDLSGRENLYTAGIVTGLQRTQIDARFDTIVDFAELSTFIDSPLRSYSTGMQMRLAFAIAIHTYPDILLVDEVLTVGDIAFQQKCLDKISELRSRGSTLILVSHDPHQVKSMCDRALWLDKGEMIHLDSAESVMQAYAKSMSDATAARMPRESVTAGENSRSLTLNENRFGTLDVEIADVKVLDEFRNPVTEIESGAPLTVQIEFAARSPVKSPIFGISISREDEPHCVDLNTDANQVVVPDLEGSGILEVSVERLDLVAGEYFVDVGIYDAEWAHAYDYHWHVYPLKIHSKTALKGFLQPPVSWHITLNDSANDSTDKNGYVAGKKLRREESDA